MKQNETIEQRVASAVLEKSTGVIEIEGKSYEIAPPSIATLILVSEIVSTLPIVEKCSQDQAVYSVLHHAKNFKKLGDIAAILILGAKSLTEERVVTFRPRFLFGLLPAFWKQKKTKKIRVNRQEELASQILLNVRPSVLFNVVIQRLKDMEIANFFAITTSLSEANLLKPTKEVDQEH